MGVPFYLGKLPDSTEAFLNKNKTKCHELCLSSRFEYFLGLLDRGCITQTERCFLLSFFSFPFSESGILL